ncbi:MFS transporter [Dongia sp.]|uniref:MFS transporter n=1 Tax=Dongia sp. TaxID=1977262 RepID=UPI0037537A10
MSGVSAISVLRNRNFFLYTLNSLLASFGAEILIVAIGWRVYEISRDPFDLALVGLAQFMPHMLLVLVTGTVADRYPRQRILMFCMLAELACTLGIFLVATASLTHTWPILLLVSALAIGRAFFGPASLALAPTLVERAQIPSAIACSTAAWQLSSIAGPALGGVLYGFAPSAAYSVALAMALVGTFAILGIRKVEEPQAREVGAWDSMIGGFAFMRREKVVLGASTLDLFAVLLGSATALLPVFAHDILVTGPWGLGLLRAGVGIGALAMALFLGAKPIRRHAGAIMFVTVAVFGLGTVVFGLSHSIGVSVGALIVMGASDMISVYIREVLVQLWTPDSLRGRVNAVYMLAISASNELGAFRAGMSASIFGAIPAVVIGGICILAVALLWAIWFPALRKADDLTAVEALEPEDAKP